MPVFWANDDCDVDGEHSESGEASIFRVTAYAASAGQADSFPRTGDHTGNCQFPLQSFNDLPGQKLHDFGTNLRGMNEQRAQLRPQDRCACEAINP